ncbi:hypothetical protein HanRHA438_Chr11g0510031 [Helianthus annuus]|nr:hypothetical protein HanIR_Chr11g0535531 [Helianthus annuus]KAJ0871244.1 hypothetical protein HanRHA438_Chr11g0510031 [Helianthus annuus]
MTVPPLFGGSTPRMGSPTTPLTPLYLTSYSSLFPTICLHYSLVNSKWVLSCPTSPREKKLLVFINMCQFYKSLDLVTRVCNPSGGIKMGLKVRLKGTSHGCMVN